MSEVNDLIDQLAGDQIDVAKDSMRQVRDLMQAGLDATEAALSSANVELQSLQAELGLVKAQFAEYMLRHPDTEEPPPPPLPTKSVLDGPTRFGVYRSGGDDPADSGYKDRTNRTIYTNSNKPLLDYEAAIKAGLKAGCSFYIARNPRGTYNQIFGLANNEAQAQSWLNADLAVIKRLGDYAESLDNGTYIAIGGPNELEGQVRQAKMPGVTAAKDYKNPTAAEKKMWDDYMALGGRGMQVYNHAVRGLNHSRVFSLCWLMGFDRGREAIQMAQLKAEDLDIVGDDPYANGAVALSLTSIALADFQWVLGIFPHVGLAITETGIGTRPASGTGFVLTDEQAEKAYGNLVEQKEALEKALGHKILAVQVFLGTGNWQHELDPNYPKGKAALNSSLTKAKAALSK